MKKLIAAVFAIFLVVGCDINNDPTPPNPDPGTETLDTFPTEYTGYEFLQCETIPGPPWMGGGFFLIPYIHIVDENGANLLTTAPGNLRDNDFQFICDGKVYRQGGHLPGFYSHIDPIGYDFDYLGAEIKKNDLGLGVMYGFTDGEKEKGRDMVFVWPEKSFKMYLRLYQKIEKIALHEGDKFYLQPGDSATQYQTGMFVNGILREGSDHATLQLNSDGNVKIIHPAP